MAGAITTMFGKAYDTVGSADKNLVLQTRGDLKVKWGGKYIDLIKNGKINVDVDLLKKVDSKDSIYKDGLYLIEGDETLEVWLQIGGTLVNLLGEVGTTYVSYVAPLDVDAEGKLRALSNIGFFYESVDDAKTANVLSGLIYILSENQLYYVNSGQIIKYEPQLNIPNPLSIGTVTIDGNTSNIYSTKNLNFSIGSTPYIQFKEDRVHINTGVVTYNGLESNDFVGRQKGYILTNTEDGESLLEADIVRVRKYLDYDNKVRVTYSKLLEMISGKRLIEGKEYTIIDFQNEWEITAPNSTYLEDDDSHIPNVHPITLTATGVNTLSKTGYVNGHPNWVIEYDIDFNYFIGTYTVINDLDNEESINLYTKGRITKMKDELGNEANYDFKHRLFKHTSNSDDDYDWFFTFNAANSDYDADSLEWVKHHANMDATQAKNSKVKNNIIYIQEPILQQRGLSEEMLVIIPDEFILFTDCDTHIPHDNKILKSSGKYIVTEDFYNNSIEGLLLNVNIRESINFDFSFHDNICGNIYIRGEYVDSSYPNTSEKYTSFATSKIYANNIFGNITDCLFSDSVLNTKFHDEYYNIYYDVVDCTFEGEVSKATFKGLVQYSDFKGDLSLVTFEKPIGKYSDSRVILNDVSNSTFTNEIQKLDATDSVIDECTFNGIIEEATIAGSLSRCNFQGLTGNILVGKTNQVISNMNVQITVGPSSASWVLQRANPLLLQQCSPLKINLDDVPRLNETAKKECFLKVIESKDVFFVQLSTDDNTPSGTIVMFYPGTLEARETLADKIPNGYAICDGLNGTPNLSGRFIKASTSTWGPVDNTDTEVVDNVRTNRIKLSADNLPKHTHSLSGVTIENASTNEASVSEGTAIQYATGTNEFTPINPSASSQNHTHTFGNNAVTGDGDFQNTSFNIEPQSYELIFIMKL